MWLLGRLVPDHKTIADFRKHNSPAIRRVCTCFITLCRQIGLLAGGTVVVDGSKFKAVNNCDRNFAHAKIAACDPDPAFLKSFHSATVRAGARRSVDSSICGN